MDERTSVALSAEDINRIFQALTQECARLDRLNPQWRTQSVVTHCEELRDRFARMT